MTKNNNLWGRNSGELSHSLEDRCYGTCKCTCKNSFLVPLRAKVLRDGLEFFNAVWKPSEG